METWADIQRGIFAGESGGDYNALYNYQNRPGGLFSNVQPTQMTINQVLEMQQPGSPYATYVRDIVGHTATPIGAYQVVGSTLRDAMRGLGLTGNEMFDQATQDRIGQWIYQNQGTGAWAGYQGPQDNGGQSMPQQQQPTGLLENLGIQRRGAGPQGDVPFYQRDRFKDVAGALAAGFNELRMRPSAAVPQAVEMGRQRRAGNRTMEWLAQQPGAEPYVQMINAGADPAAVLLQYRQDQAASVSAQQGRIQEVDGRLVRIMPDGSVTEIYSPTQGGDPADIAKLRTEFTAQPAVKDFYTLSRSYGAMIQSANQVSGPGDMGVIFNYMKLLDPGSTVREGEYATAQNSGGASAQIRSLYNSIIDGQKLTPEQRDQFIAAGGSLYQNAQSQFNSVADQYRGFAERAGIDPSQVIVTSGYAGAPYQQQSIPQPPAPAGIDPADWETAWANMTPEERRAFIGGNP